MRFKINPVLSNEEKGVKGVKNVKGVKKGREYDSLMSNISRLKIIKMLSGLFFSVPILTLYFKDVGLSMYEVFLLQSIFSGAIILLEIPSGYFADLKGRKLSIIISNVAVTLAFVSYALAGLLDVNPFLTLVFSELLFAVAVSFNSGAMSALVYDTLKAVGREGEYKKVWGSLNFYFLITLSLANVVGGLIAKAGFLWTFYATIPFAIIKTIISLGLKEVDPGDGSEENEEGVGLLGKDGERAGKGGILFKDHVRNTLKIIKYAMIDNKKISLMILFSSLIFLFSQSTFWFYQPYLQLCGLDIAYFGLIFGSFQLIAAISSREAHRFEKRVGFKRMIFILLLLMSASLLLMGSFVTKISFLFILLQQASRGLRITVISDYLNKASESKIRATLLSTDSLIRNLSFTLIGPIIGWFSNLISLEELFIFMGVILFMTGLLLLGVMIKAGVFEDVEKIDKN